MTTKERNAAYKKALNRIENNQSEFICFAFDALDVSINPLEEFLLVMPEQWEEGDALFCFESHKWFTYEEKYWFIPYKELRTSYTERMKALKETILCICIAMTEN